MDVNKYLASVEKKFKKKFSESEVEFKSAAEEKPANGIIIDNPQLEFILDRRFLAYGRFYLTYGKKGCSKTSLFYDLAKLFQKNNGIIVWIETEHAIDLDYAKKQGVDLSRVRLHHPKSLEEAIGIAEMYIRELPKDDPEGETPVLICLDSIAGSTTEYEMDESHSVHDVMPGQHARILSRFYREMEQPLGNEKCVFLAINQLREKIGAFGFSPDAADSMIGGNAPLFHSTYQWKMIKKEELVMKDVNGVERKIGSVHVIQSKRNKLGREGKGQDVEVDLYINGGMDWYSPLVRRLGKGYTNIVGKSGGFYYWKPEGTKYVKINEAGEQSSEMIDPEQAYREHELAQIIANSSEAKEIIRKAFGIPNLPSDQEIKEIETERLTKRKKRTKTLSDEPTIESVPIKEV